MKNSVFPRKLYQPDVGYRFSVDSLLLASFVRPKKHQIILDLGTGCGVIALGVLILNPTLDLKIVGVELDDELIKCAKKNINLLGFNDCFFLLNIDLKRFNLKKEFFDIVMFNPPYRGIEEGRLSPYSMKNKACFNLTGSLEDFVKKAFYLLKNKGDLYVIYLSKKLTRLLDCLSHNRLEPKRIRFVYPRLDKDASFVLVMAKKNSKKGVKIEPPLILYSGKDNTPTQGFVKFCPFL